MCGYSSGKLGQFNTDIKLGYSGGKLTVGVLSYKGESVNHRKEMYKVLSKFKKDEIINLLLDFVENADE